MGCTGEKERPANDDEAADDVAPAFNVVVCPDGNGEPLVCCPECVSPPPPPPPCGSLHMGRGTKLNPLYWYKSGGAVYIG